MRNKPPQLTLSEARVNTRPKKKKKYKIFNRQYLKNSTRQRKKLKIKMRGYRDRGTSYTIEMENSQLCEIE